MQEIARVNINTIHLLMCYNHSLYQNTTQQICIAYRAIYFRS